MFNIFIDESGTYKVDTAAKRETNYLVLSAAAVPLVDCERLRSKLRESAIFKTNGKPLHSKNIKTRTLLDVAEFIASEDIYFFAAVSCKASVLDQGPKTWAERSRSDHFEYAKTIHRMLLERVGAFFTEMTWNDRDARLKMASAEITAEQHSEIDMVKLNEYISKCRKKPLNQKVGQLKGLPCCEIKQKSKEDEPLLFLADIFAYGVGQTLIDGERRFIESDLIRYLGERIWHNDDDGSFLDRGMRFIPSAREVCKSRRLLHLYTRSLPLEICDARQEKSRRQEQDVPSEILE
ncbi:DUF3800 domain-containing protein [Rhodovulum steppense]|uniref:Uncharacterized protein DUF3800 n=1 Tax=Rhodovulum steppense TaxID=540251 RepID=A0A4R1Z382_9RHOB|nr:DUF3800 domain-containing protein [Rhodovulum steppense]TCM88142.1 uncharacterized protein DUF3800 [Rhodovulum steppense]